MRLCESVVRVERPNGIAEGAKGVHCPGRNTWRGANLHPHPDDGSQGRQAVGSHPGPQKAPERPFWFPVIKRGLSEALQKASCGPTGCVHVRQKCVCPPGPKGYTSGKEANWGSARTVRCSNLGMWRSTAVMKPFEALSKHTHTHTSLGIHCAEMPPKCQAPNC